jgi:hypothetical protein
MAAREKLVYRLGTTWTLTVNCYTPQGTPIADLSDARLRIWSPAGGLLLDQRATTGATLSDNQAVFTINPAAQTSFAAGEYLWMVESVQSSGPVLEQAGGACTVQSSPFVTYP